MAGILFSEVREQGALPEKIFARKTGAYPDQGETMSAREQYVIDELVFLSYVHNRMEFPNVAPERWRLVYGLRAAAAMEARFVRTFVLKLIEAADESGEARHV